MERQADMDALFIARCLHVLGVVVWIGGVGMVTAVILPAARSFRASGMSVEMFEAIERRFVRIARAMTLIVGLSGLYMLWALHLWDRFADISFWWMHAMVAIWALFTIMLFIIEPFFLHDKFAARARIDPAGTFARMQRFHWIVFVASLITIFGAVAGAHGYAFFR
jgi:uncharacterized membrane protein